MALAQLFYVSRATLRCDPAGVQSILATSRRNNRQADLTGCLLFTGSFFAQVLEGPHAALHERYARIAADARHCDVRLVLERAMAAREYGDWSMGYLHDLDYGDELTALLTEPTLSAERVAELSKRMRPDTVMGALG